MITIKIDNRHSVDVEEDDFVIFRCLDRDIGCYHQKQGDIILSVPDHQCPPESISMPFTEQHYLTGRH